MTTKALAWFFFALSVLNVPVMMFFAAGNAAGELNAFPDLFAILSLGNIGQSDHTCGAVQVASQFEKDPAALGYSA